MAKGKPVKKDLLDDIEEKIQALNLLRSAIQTDRSRRPEVLEEYRKKYVELLSVKK